ncbi:neurolysin, mitochondrial [Elysia marginata]|uniref:Neurolysin, mitochondrial n=1 Tax=Elysia marginata TaxID=1093978 RepID=A0AAV4GND6_9GAST|nr:neurolysin, mitochondrial [Elysia marginata]
MAADGIKLCWNVKKENIESDAEKLMERMKTVYDAIGKLSDDEVTYENVVQTAADCDCWSAVERNNIDFLQHVSSNKELRDASVAADKKLSEFDVELSKVGRSGRTIGELHQSASVTVFCPAVLTPSPPPTSQLAQTGERALHTVS